MSHSHEHNVITRVFSSARPKLGRPIVGVIVALSCCRFLAGMSLEVVQDEHLKASNQYLYNTHSVCLSSIGGQTTGPIMTKFGTHMRIDLGMVPTINWPHEWPGSVGSLGPISESGLSCQLLLRAVVWQMTLCGK